MPTLTPLKLPRFQISNLTPGRSLLLVVQGSERLKAALPADELAPLVAAHEAATAAVKEARALPSGEVDFTDEIDAAFREGAPIEVASLLTRIANAGAASEGRTRVIRVLSELPEKYAREMFQIILSDLDIFYAALTRDLDNLLDEASDAADSLAGISTAEQAIDAGKSDSWSQLRTLWHEYSRIRVEHSALLSYESDQFTSETLTNLGFAFFDGIAEVIPDYYKIVKGQMIGLDGRPMRMELPWPALDPSRFEHFRMTVMLRDALRPHVATPAQAFESAARVPAQEARGTSAADLGLTVLPGSRVADYTMTRIADAGAQRADDIRHGRIDPDY